MALDLASQLGKTNQFRLYPVGRSKRLKLRSSCLGPIPGPLYAVINRTSFPRARDRKHDPIWTPLSHKQKTKHISQKSA